VTSQTGSAADPAGLEQEIHRLHELVEGCEAQVVWDDDRVPHPDNPRQPRQIYTTIRRADHLAIVEWRIHKNRQGVKWMKTHRASCCSIILAARTNSRMLSFSIAVGRSAGMSSRPASFGSGRRQIESVRAERLIPSCPLSKYLDLRNDP